MSFGVRRTLGLVVATAILFLVLAQPNHPDAMGWSALAQLPLELPLIVLTLLVLRAGAVLSYAARAAIVVVLTLASVLKLADYATFTAFNRSFNPLMDTHLAEAGLRLAGGSVGWPLALGLAVLVGLTPFVLAWLLWWATGRWVRVDVPAGWRRAAAGGAVAVLAILVVDLGAARRAWALPFDVPGEGFSTRLVLERSETFRALYADLAAFAREADDDPFVGAAPLFDRLGGRDVLVAFVESYGQTVLEHPLYAPTHVPTLERAETALRAAGLAVRSAWLTSPVAGGQSWLAHATLASGLSIENQARYRAMLASPRQSLYHLAQSSGYRTATVMPAITLPWPEAQFMGFSTIYEAKDLGYRGAAFNWTTMPDQYTLSAIERLLPDGNEPVFAMTALLSSHAPWTPVPMAVDWAAIGDGAIFDERTHAGPPGGAVWADRELMREQYRLAIDYALATVFDFAARNAERDWLMIVLGDHPPAASVSLIEGQDVPIHLVGSDAAMALFDAWDWTNGLIPEAGAPVWPMSAFRDRFIAAVSSAEIEVPASP